VAADYLSEFGAFSKSFRPSFLEEHPSKNGVKQLLILGFHFVF
jgi:hypothetical protein